MSSQTPHISLYLDNHHCLAFLVVNWEDHISKDFYLTLFILSYFQKTRVRSYPLAQPAMFSHQLPKYYKGIGKTLQHMCSIVYVYSVWTWDGPIYSPWEYAQTIMKGSRAFKVLNSCSNIHIGFLGRGSHKPILRKSLLNY